jgi:hypothetical protein
MTDGVRVAHPFVVLHSGGMALVCGLDGHLAADELHGFFCADTRVLSTYRIAIGDHAWQLLGRSRPDHASAQWTFQSPAIRDPAGNVPEGTLFLSLRRRLDGVLRDDLTVSSFRAQPIRTRFTLQLDADFADIFEVRARSLPPRLGIRRIPGPRTLRLAYAREGFRRGLCVRFEAPGPPPVFVGAQVVFELALCPGESWCCRLEATPEIDVAGDVGRSVRATPARPAVGHIARSIELMAR